MAYDNSNYGEGKELAYDLRQRYAMELADIRASIIIARNKLDYPNWYALIDSLFIEISPKLKDTEIEEVNKTMNKINKIISKNRKVYSGSVRGSQGLIYSELKSLSMKINKYMEKYEMFGKRGFVEGI